MSDEELHLLTSPIERRLVSRLFVIGGPIGLAIAIVLSLWVSQQRVTHAVIVQTEPRWIPGETLALRVQVTPESPKTPGPTKVEVAVEQGGQRHPLPSPAEVKPGWLAQGRVVVPALEPGPAMLHVHVAAEPFEPRDERIPIEVVERREAIEPQHVVSSSASQYADDSDAQPEGIAIDVRPVGRVLAGFENELLLRVTDPEGKPWSGPAAIHLLDGELAGKRGRGDDPPLLWEGRTDGAGLASVRGLLSSEVLRLRVQLRAEGEPAGEQAKAGEPTTDASEPKGEGEPKGAGESKGEGEPKGAGESKGEDESKGEGEPKSEGEPPAAAQTPAPQVLHERKIRLVSFAGAVQLEATPLQVAPGSELEVLVAGLSAKRPVFVDVFGPDGAWIDTFDPPVQGREPARAWGVSAALSGLVQLEAYHFTNEPGESTAVARVLALATDSIDPADKGGGVASLRPGLRIQRSRLSVPRADRTWNEERERGYLAWLGKATLSASEVDLARRWVLGTLPIEIHGPPTLLRSRERDLAAMAAYKRSWTIGLRIFLLGGGALFLAAMTVLMIRSHDRDATATLEELQCLNEGVEREQLEAHVHAARRAALLRGLLVVGMMAVGLVSASLLLENLVWEF